MSTDEPILRLEFTIEKGYHVAQLIRVSDNKKRLLGALDDEAPPHIFENFQSLMRECFIGFQGIRGTLPKSAVKTMLTEGGPKDICNEKRCLMLSTHRLQLVFELEDKTNLICETNFFVCDQHADQENADEIFTDSHMVEQISSNLIDRKLAAQIIPDKSFARWVRHDHTIGV